MVEPLKAAAAAAEAEAEACLADDLLLLDFSSGGSGGGGGEPEHQFLLDLLDQADITAVDSTPGLQTEGGGGEAAAEEEEELEWLSNKDAFPSLETSFEIPGHSRSSSGGSGSRSWCSAAAASAVLVAARPFWVSVRARSKGRRRTSRVLPVFPPAAEPGMRGDKRKCRHCEAEQTPQWRAGPDGPKTLCNACGVRYNSGRLMPEYRPASSPTFSALLHSNSHRQILEMRRRGSARGRRSSRLPTLLAAAGSLL